MKRGAGGIQCFVRFSAPRRVLGAVFFVLLGSVSTFVGCGGGTTGTGGSGSDDFAGRVLSVSGTPIVQATVTVEETGDSSVTDSNGEFRIEASSATPQQATLLVETATAHGSVVVDELTDVPAVVEVSLRLDEKNNSLAVTAKKVTPKKKRPTPRPTPQPTLQNVTPTPVVETPVVETPVPTNTETPAPTPPEVTPTQTESPSVAPSPSPTKYASPTPIPALAVFRGVVSASDPTLLVDAKIGLVGESRRVKIKSDGTFFFRASPAPGGVLAIKSGQSFAKAALDGVTNRTQKVILGLELSHGVRGHLLLAVNSIRIIEGSGSEPSLEPIADESEP